MVDLKLSSMVPRSLTPETIATKRVIHEFVEQTGMVYFGYVSQRDDDHHILRGMTVSNKHHDDHYCIGTIEGYDTVFVERTDTLKNGKKHRWHIMEFDLKSTADLPHVFIGSGKHGHGFHELLTVKYPSLTALTKQSLVGYDESFLDKFNVYTRPAHFVDFEKMIPPHIAATISSHFAGLVIEITEQALYVYSEKPHLTTDLMLTMAQNGSWLAKQIDENSRLL